MDHELLPSPETVHWGYFDGRLRPALTIEPGDTVTILTVSGSADDLPPPGFTVSPALRAIHAAVVPELGPHILTGPIAVQGAETGDVLRLTILEVSLADDWAFNLIRPGLGALPDLFPYERTIHLPIDQADRRVHTPWGLTLPARPFFGVMGTAPSLAQGRVSSVAPGSFGGNMDNRELVAGAVLFLPVAVPGGLVSIGDGHAVQGEGEVCLTAAETGLRGTFKIDLLKGLPLDAPFAETPTHLITMGFDEDLDVAVNAALRRLIALLQNRTKLSAEDAYRLCSLAAELRVTQLVNRSKGAHAMIAHDLVRPILR